MQVSGDHPDQISVEVFFCHFALLWSLDLEPYQVRQCNKRAAWWRAERPKIMPQRRTPLQGGAEYREVSSVSAPCGRSMAFPKREPRPDSQRAGSREPSECQRVWLRGLRFANLRARQRFLTVRPHPQATFFL
jgi:hypothetical protein